MFYWPFVLSQLPLSLMGHRSYCRSINCYHAGRDKNEARVWAACCVLAWGVSVGLQFLTWKWDGRFMGTCATGLFIFLILMVWKTVGITGQMCAGKSTLGEMLRKAGVPVIKADEVAREVITFPKVLKSLIASFGPQIIGEDGLVDREKLGNIVAETSGGLKQLEEILHPAIIKTIGIRLFHHKLAAWFRGRPMVAIDAPLLHETNLSFLCGPVVCVDVSPETQAKRLQERGVASDGRSDGVKTPEEIQKAQKLIANQLTHDQKRNKSDVIISNNGTLQEFQYKVRRYFIHAENMAFFE